MLIDWFTVGAQALNFIILVWLLKRFLYRPILDAVDAREKRIAAELADADEKKAEAKKERDEFHHKNEQFDQQRAALMSKATDEANAERRRLLDNARNAADALSTKRQKALQNEANTLTFFLVSDALPYCAHHGFSLVNGIICWEEYDTISLVHMKEEKQENDVYNPI